jgi:ADP-ribosyl-[dinitrogen reductase] hydrolase
MPLEFGPPRRGDDQVREFIGGRLPLGAFTDDTEMALALAESLVAHGRLAPEDVAQRFVAWYQSGPADVGNQTSQALLAAAQGEPWDQAAPRSEYGAGNGSLMRCHPAALAYHEDLEACLQASRTQSIITHPHPECQAACAWANALIWHALRGADVETALGEAMGAVPDVPEALRQTIEAAPSRATEELENSGWVRHTVESAVWGLTTTDSFEDCVVAVANLGNDADTAAAVAGALAGAVYGQTGIPTRWRQAVWGYWPIRSESVWREKDLAKLADELLGVAP